MVLFLVARKMEIEYFLSEIRDGVRVVHSSAKSCRAEVVPNNIDELYKLLKMYASPVHQNHLNNNYLVLYDKNNEYNDLAFIDLKNLKENIRDRKGRHQ